MHVSTIVRFALATVLFGLGCGGGATGAFSTDVARDKQLGSLTSDDRSNLCVDLHGYLVESGADRDLCRVAAFLKTAIDANTMSALSDADLQMACTQALTECSSGETTTCELPSTTCTATVGELAACVNDDTPVLHAAAAGFPECGSLTRATLHDFMPDPSSSSNAPESCVAFQAKCPHSGIPGSEGG